MRRGFTILEGFMVIVIIGTLLSLLIPAVLILRNNHFNGKTLSGLEQIQVLKEYEVPRKTAIDAYITVKIVKVQGKRMALFVGSDSLAVTPLPEE